MAFIVRGQCNYTLIKCLAKTILLLDICKTSYVVSFCCAHITCPMQIIRGMNKQRFVSRRVTSEYTVMSRQGGGHANVKLYFLELGTGPQ